MVCYEVRGPQPPDYQAIVHQRVCPAASGRRAAHELRAKCETSGQLMTAPTVANGLFCANLHINLHYCQHCQSRDVLMTLTFLGSVLQVT